MSASIEVIVTPTSDTRGTTLVLRTPSKHYVFGNLAEGTQRACVQQGTKLLKAQDFFLTGRSEWKNIGGLMGMMLTLADSSISSYEQALETQRKAIERGKLDATALKPHFNIYGPPNLKHTLTTCRRFIFRRGIPFVATEYMQQAPQKDEAGTILPSFQDDNIKVWAFAVKPTGFKADPSEQTKLELRRQLFDTHHNSFLDYQAKVNESANERSARYDRIRSTTIKQMFDSDWTFDTLTEHHISEAEPTAALFVRNPETRGFEPYQGPMPGGTGLLPDVKVFTRTPWPGAMIKALPPTQPELDCVSYIMRTHPSRGAFDVAKAKALGIAPGRAFGRLANGEAVQNSSGEWVQPRQVLGPERPGQAVAILEIPSVDYLQATLDREELYASESMTGVQAFIWMLGPGVVHHSIFQEYIKKMSQVQHLVSSTDTSLNRIAYDSAAAQTIRLGQIDPARYSTPRYDNITAPHSIINSTKTDIASPPSKDLVVIDRGLSMTLMPKFAVKIDTTKEAFIPESAVSKIEPQVFELAKQAHQTIESEKQAMQTWRRLVARPDTEVITLGTGSALPSKYRNVSATLVRVNGVGNYLFDCGENTLGQLARVFSAKELHDVLQNLRMIWISHLHADHHLGTASVIKAWYDIVHAGVPNKTPFKASAASKDGSASGLAVISHNGMLQWLDEYSSIEDFGYSRILPLEISFNNNYGISNLKVANSFSRESFHPSAWVPMHDYERLFGFTDIQAVRVSHCLGAMALSITFPASPEDDAAIKPLKVSYSGDCRPSRHFAKIGLDTTVLIHEATFDDELIGDAIAKKHSTTSEALGIGASMNAKAVVLTHFSQRYQKIPVLQNVADDEPAPPVPDPADTAEDAADAHAEEINPNTMTVRSTAPANPPSSLQHNAPSLHENGRVITVRNKDMKVAVAFDYMRVKIGDIIELEHFNEALNALLVQEEDVEGTDKAGKGENVNANGKKMSEDEAGGCGKRVKRAKSKRND